MSGVSAFLRHGQAAILPVATLALVALMIVPIPAILLDIGFITNIVIALAVLMVALNAAKPLDFSSFPTVLLFATLLRLALNVASTRVVLVSGHEGPGAAGHVIEAFGTFLIGGDYAVGIFVFMILMIINLVVITKGAGRVSEVSARFTLDALPGKQMAIDADLNAGLMTPDEARARRQEVATEAGFYGSMDGASKFVKGDAVAGVLILVINIVGGLVLGVVSHDMAIGDAARTYVLLAIGDALVAQVPALLLSIAAAAIVTRVASPMDLSGQIVSQFASARAWAPVAAILALLGILPGMPHLIILPAAALCGFIAWRLHQAARVVAAPVAEVELPGALPAAIEWAEVTDVATLGLELGYGLVGLVDDRRQAPLMARITGIRRQLSRELGFVVPLVRVRDNLTLPPRAYRIIVNGVVLGEDEVLPDMMLALDGGDTDGPVEGIKVMDPTFGMDAYWIAPERRAEAIAAGYTVVDAPTVIATHLNQLVIANAAELFGLDDADKLIETLKETAPQLVAGLTPQPLSLLDVAGCCRALLEERIGIKDFRRIVEAMVGAARISTDPAMLEANVRERIGAIIVQGIVPLRLPLPVITFDGELEGLLTQAVRTGPAALHPFEPSLANRVVASVREAAAPMAAQGRPFALVTSPPVRKAVRHLLQNHLELMHVLAYPEIPASKPVEVVAVVSGRPEPQPALMASPS